MVTTEVPLPALVAMLHQFAELFPVAKRNALEPVINSGLLSDSYLHIVQQSFGADPNYIKEEPVGRTACLKLVEILLAMPEVERYQRVPRTKGHIGMSEGE